MKKAFYFLAITLMLFGCKKEDEEKSTEKRLTSFIVGTATAVTINESDKTVAVTLPAGTSVDALTPIIKVSEKARVSPESGEPRNFTQPVLYIVTAEDGSTARYMVTVTIEKHTEAKIMGFTFDPFGQWDPPVNGEIDEAAKTITLAIPYGADMSALAPWIVCSVGAEVSPPSRALQDFTQPVTYTVTAESGATATYTVTVTEAAFATTIVDVSTTQVVAGGGLYITGKFAASDNVVTLEGITVVTASIVSQEPDMIAVSVPANTPPGEYNLSVTSNGAKASYSKPITVFEAVPVISSVSDVNPCIGSILTVKGANFGTDAEVYLSMVDGMYHKPEIVSRSANEIVIKTNRMVDNEPYVSITVTSGGKEGKAEISFIPHTCTPQITGISPNSGKRGSTITITGVEFGYYDEFTIMFGDVDTFQDPVSATECQVVVPKDAPLGTVQLDIYNGKEIIYSTMFTVLE